TECEERRGLEARRVLRLLGTRRLLRQCARHPDDLERAVTQVVSLLGVEGEDAVCQCRVVRQKRGDRAQTELLRGGKAMPAVRGQKAISTGVANPGAKKQPRWANRNRQWIGLGRGQFRLERRRFHARDRQRREDEW